LKDLFTGIVEAVGEVISVDGGDAGRTLVVAAPFAEELKDGQSVAVDGACLTAIAVGRGTFTVEVGSSTLERTVAGRYAPGTPVNLERAIRLGDRLDGHLVQGHVDGLGTYLGGSTVGETRFLEFELPADVFSTTILHGSIALHGISLTVNRLRPEVVCEVAVIPFTWKHTNLFSLESGDSVNVECDLVGKYVRRMVETHGL